MLYIKDFLDENGNTVKQRIYQIEKEKDLNWYHIAVKIYDPEGQALSYDGGFYGTKEFLQLEESELEKILYVKKAPW